MNKPPPKQRRTQAERREEAETQLIIAATKLLVQKGYDRFSLADVGTAAGFSRGLPTHYFKRKEDLLSAVAERIVDGYNDKLLELPPMERGLPTLKKIVQQYVRGAGRERSKALFLLTAEAITSRKLRRKISALNSRGLATLEREIQAGIDLGNVRPDTDAQKQARVIYSFMRGVMTFAAIDAEFEAERIGEEFISTLQARIGIDR